MLRSSDSETEILLGNKQLIGIFFVVAILLGIAFASGFVVGKSQSGKKAAGTQEIASNPVASQETGSSTGGETHSVPGETAGSADPSVNAAPDPHVTQEPNAGDTVAQPEPPLGSRKGASREQSMRRMPVAIAPGSPSTIPADTFTPQVGQQFLQVAAVSKDEAEAVADVLHKKGFRAHAVPKPGSTKLYRVIVGPIRDAGDLNATRDSLVRTGFREVIVQRY